MKWSVGEATVQFDLDEIHTSTSQQIRNKSPSVYPSKSSRTENSERRQFVPFRLLLMFPLLIKVSLLFIVQDELVLVVVGPLAAPVLNVVVVVIILLESPGGEADDGRNDEYEDNFIDGPRHV